MCSVRCASIYYFVFVESWGRGGLPLCWFGSSCGCNGQVQTGCATLCVLMVDEESGVHLLAKASILMAITTIAI